MSVRTLSFEVETRGMTDVVDLTGQIAEKLDECGLKDGTVTVFVPGSTAGITTIEYEPGMQQDIPIYFEKIAPYGGYYHHQETWNDDNGAAHFRAALLGPSLTVPFVNAHMTLGTWQQVVLVCFDTRPRRRKIILQILGE
ncbi:MAG TPA: secondary thiamine-phosphate synthase enzyme YjbQ [Anaerolineales bacterium]|nr:secondary thiamine-phosphate synthase enzyme YjbQ [Anaerolineales bacterium]